MRRTITFAIFILALASLNSREPVVVETVAAAPDVQKEPLYHFRSKRGRDFYKRGGTVPAGLTGGPWNNQGPICLVARQSAPGLKPVYMFRAVREDIVLYGYDTDSTNPKLFKAPGVWTTIGVEFYVASTQLPGTVPLYGASRDFLWKANTPEDVASSGTFRLTIDQNQAHSKTFDNYHGILGYVWTEDSLTDLPDLTVAKTTVRDNGIEAIIRNQGKRAASSQPGVSAVLYVQDPSGKVVHFSGAKQLGGMSPGQLRPFFFDTGNLDLKRKQYRVQVDAGSLIAESNENNNDTGIIDVPMPKMKINPVSGDQVRPPSIAITGTRDVPPKFGRPHMAYRVTVHNWDQYPTEYFQSMKGKLPPNPCGDTRMQARITIYQGGKFFKADCKALHTPQDLKTFETVSSVLGDADEISVTLVDRLTNETYASERFAVGWYGLGELLDTVGCKSFLGRASQYICHTDKGMAACEDLRQKGKPIECRRAGK